MNESGGGDLLPAVRSRDEILFGTVREAGERCTTQERDVESGVEPPTITPFPQFTRRIARHKPHLGSWTGITHSVKGRSSSTAGVSPVSWRNLLKTVRPRRIDCLARFNASWSNCGGVGRSEAEVGQHFANSKPASSKVSRIAVTRWDPSSSS